MDYLKKVFVLVVSFALFAATTTRVYGNNTLPSEVTMHEDVSRHLRTSRLCEDLPDKYRDHFASVISLPYEDRATLEITDLRKVSDSDGLVVSLKGHGLEYLTLKHTDSSTVDICKRDVRVLSVILDKKTGSPISARDMGIMPGGKEWAVGEIKNVCIRLPEDFNSENHSIVFFFYYYFGSLYGYPQYHFTDPTDIMFDENDQYFAISSPIEVDLSFESVYGNGDATDDGFTNISDVSLMLKHISRWDIVGFNKIRADANCNGIIELSDCSVILKRIAGWQDEKITAKYYMDSYALIEDKEYGDVQLGTTQS